MAPVGYLGIQSLSRLNLIPSRNAWTILRPRRTEYAVIRFVDLIIVPTRVPPA
ncbi:hypothetical protein M413DRAFT_439392 [Hebeloma cylindrosporum]|uniref:Uncharacterized protein n=1 Tax=Hebeloma cylindrosporum TaxID=76867 RepID=A0A0C3CV48_HEBCY|nr:hypothetical protein M413DRAFT_439392 [Hebeloma cylindrosporum h7]